MRRLLTVTALATALVGALALAAPAEAASGGVVITKVQYDSPGNDLPATNAKINAEWVRLTNTSKTTKTITGWTLRDRQSHVYKFPTTKIGPGKSLYVRSGKGTNSSTMRYMRFSYYIWNNTGDKAYLRNSSGTLVDSCAWSKGKGYTYC